MKERPIKIVSLKECPLYATICAHWSYQQWYLDRDIPFEANLKAYQLRATSDSIPCVFVALWGTYPVGMVSLKEKDLWNRPDLDPWLASLYVIPDFRNSGIGERLVMRVLEKAMELNYEKLYLFLGRNEVKDLALYYEKRGWKYLEDGVDNDGKETKIYSYNLRLQKPRYEVIF